MACLTDDDMDLLFENDPTPDDAAEQEKLLGDAEAITERCARAGGERALHMSSTEVARDMDVMRALVGDEQLNFFGGVLRNVPRRSLRRSLPRARWVASSSTRRCRRTRPTSRSCSYDVQGFESSMDAFIEWCVSRDDCALGTDAEGAQERIADLLDDVERAPSRPRGATSTRSARAGSASPSSCASTRRSPGPLSTRGSPQALDGKGDILLAHAMNVVGRSASGSTTPRPTCRP